MGKRGLLEYLGGDGRIGMEGHQRHQERLEMETRGAKARSTRKSRVTESERKAKAARPAGRGRLTRVVKARGGKIPVPANDTLPPDVELPETVDEAATEATTKALKETALPEAALLEPEAAEGAELSA